MPYFNDPKRRAVKELAPGVRTRTFWGEQMLLSVVEIDANSGMPSPTHAHEQAGMVIEGQLEMGIGDEVHTLGPGEIYIVPGNVEHYARCSETPAKILGIYSPVREEFKY